MSVSDIPIIHSGSDGGSNAIHFPKENQTYSTAYLLIEGIFLQAKRIPNRLFVRLPKIKDQSQYIDVTFARAATIVKHLIDTMPTLLKKKSIEIKPGAVFAVITLPSAHSFFLCLALIRLGCVVQWIDHSLGRNAIDALVDSKTGSSAAAILHAGLTEEEANVLGIEDLFQRTGTHPFQLPIELYSAHLAEHVPQKTPREPVSEEQLLQQFGLDDLTFMIHTSGTTGLAKLLKFTLWSSSKVVEMPPQAAGVSKLDDVKPFLLISRPFWGTSLLFIIRAWTLGMPLSFCYPNDRLYPTIEETFDAVKATDSCSTLMYPAQIPYSIGLVSKSSHYHAIASSMRSIIFCGAGLDDKSNELLVAMKLPNVQLVNFHGWSEIAGGTGLVCNSAPYDGLFNLRDWALFEPLEPDDEIHDEKKRSSRLVRLWISLDCHPQAWYLASRNYTTAKIGRFPGPGKYHDRPATNTGDIFEERDVGQGRPRYFYYSRDDETLALTNNLKPNVFVLESALLKHLTKPGRLPREAIDAVQIFGNMKPKMAAIVQLTFEAEKSSEDIGELVSASIQDLDEMIPVPIRFNNLDRVKIVFAPSASTKSSGEILLLKTHKDTIRRRLNANNQLPWINSLKWD